MKRLNRVLESKDFLFIVNYRVNANEINTHSRVTFEKPITK